MAETSAMANIINYPEDPVDLFKELVERWGDNLLTMNLAERDDEFEVLNRTVVYRGLVDNAVSFVTERNSQKYLNLKKNPKVCTTFYFPMHVNNIIVPDEIWQVRLIDATAIELTDEQIAKFWLEESLYAKIRSHICECGKRINHVEQQIVHDRVLQDYQNGKIKLDQTESYTAFKIVPKRWDFYKTETNKIADRLQYRLKEGTTNDWLTLHVAA